MKTFYPIVAAALVVGAPFASATAANARSSIEKEIHMKRGETCWSYKGNATLFYGKFICEQYVEVRGFAEVGGTLQDAKIAAYGLRRNRRIEVTQSDQQPPSFTPKGEWNSQPLQITFALDFNTESECCGPQKINVVYFHVCANVPE